MEFVPRELLIFQDEVQSVKTISNILKITTTQNIQKSVVVADQLIEGKDKNALATVQPKS